MFLWHSPLVILWENAWKTIENYRKTRENYRKTFRWTGYSLVFSWCWITCDELRVFPEFYWGWTMNLPHFSDIGKRQFNVEFLSHSPFRKINSEHMFFCRGNLQVFTKWKKNSGIKYKSGYPMSPDMFHKFTNDVHLSVKFTRYKLILAFITRHV